MLERNYRTWLFRELITKRYEPFLNLEPIAKLLKQSRYINTTQSTLNIITLWHVNALWFERILGQIISLCLQQFHRKKIASQRPPNLQACSLVNVNFCIFFNSFQFCVILFCLFVFVNHVKVILSSKVGCTD